MIFNEKIRETHHFTIHSTYIIHRYLSSSRSTQADTNSNVKYLSYTTKILLAETSLISKFVFIPTNTQNILNIHHPVKRKRNFAATFKRICTNIAMWLNVPTHFVKTRTTNKFEYTTETTDAKMICLLCYESNDECISLGNAEAKQCSIPRLLQKYFQFCFEVSVWIHLNNLLFTLT